MIGGMLRRSRCGRVRRWQAAVLVAFAVGLLAQSLLAVVGETHQVAAHDGLTHSHAHHADPHDHEAHGAADDMGEGATLHVLLHHVNCGGHCAWINGIHAASPAVTWLTFSQPRDSARRVAASDWSAPFRPPAAG